MELVAYSSSSEGESEGGEGEGGGSEEGEAEGREEETGKDRDGDLPPRKRTKHAQLWVARMYVTTSIVYVAKSNQLTTIGACRRVTPPPHQ